MTQHLISFIGITLCALFLPLWVFVCAALLYAVVFASYELLILAVCIDAIFGDPLTGAWYVYTLITAIVLTVAFIAKPHLRFYE